MIVTMMLMTLMLILWHYSFWGWPVQFLHQTSLHPLKDKEEDCVLLKKLNQLKKGSKITWTIAMEKIPSNYLNYSWVTSPRSRCQTNLPKGQTQVMIIFFFNWVCQVCQAQGMIMEDGMTFVPASLHLRWWLFIKSSSLTFPPERLRPSPLSSLSLDNLDSPRLSSGPEPNYLS